MRFSGMNFSIFSANSPCGSTMPTPSPFRMSCMAIFSRSVVLPTPVLPMTYICLALSRFLMPNFFFSFRKLVSAKYITLLSFSAIGLNVFIYIADYFFLEILKIVQIVPQFFVNYFSVYFLVIMHQNISKIGYAHKIISQFLQFGNYFI